MGDWNAILDSTIDKAGRGASESDRCESSQIGLMSPARFGRQVSCGSPGEGDVDVAR